MIKLLSLIRRYPYQSIIIVLCFFIFASNYTPGTILSGWDTLHPEFNRILYLKRIIFGVWQEHQGLGALATQSHVAELPRLLLYYALTLIFDQSFVRYAYFFLMILFGPLGMYFFIRRIILEDNKNFQTQIASTIGGIFYLLNLGTMQHFIVPFEMFATHFASLGWVYLILISYLQTNRKLTLIAYSILTIFIASISHTPTLWYVYFVSLIIFLSTYSFLSRCQQTIKQALMIIALTITLNAFWIMPNLYFIFTDGHDVERSKIHSLFSEEAFEQNAAFGTINDFIFFKNFLFNWKVYNFDSNQFSPLLDAWILHLKNPIVLILGYLFFAIVLLGIVYSLKKRHLIAISTLPLYFICLFFWLNINPPFGNLFVFLQEHIPLFKEVFRFPFTKFSILLIFLSAIYFSLGISFLLNIFTKVTKQKYIWQFLFIIIVLSQVYYMLPAFQGYFISPAMRVRIPEEYFALFSWFDKQPNGRVASLPIHSFWGWTYYKWGYQGAGFIWFGIKQPILDREFDRWNPLNEQYYREMSHAVYSKDPTLLDKVLRKYNIKYILLDKNVIAPGSNSSVLFYNEIEQMLSKLPNIYAPVRFGKNILVYKTKYFSSSLQLVTNPKIISPEARSFYKDEAYAEYGDYITLPTNSSSKKNIDYPFRNIIDNQNRVDKNKISLTKEGILFKIPNNYTKIKQVAYTSTERLLPTQTILQRDNKNIKLLFYPYLIAQNQYSLSPITLTAQLPEMNYSQQISIVVNNTYISTLKLKDVPENVSLSLGTIMLQTDRDNTVALFSDYQEQMIPLKFSPQLLLPFACDPKNINNKIYGFTLDKDENGFTLFGKDTAVCLMISLAKEFPILQTDTLVKLQYNTDTITTNLCLVDLNDGKCKNNISKNYNTNVGGTTVSLYFSLKAEQERNAGLKIVLDATNSQKVLVQSHFYNASLHIPKQILEFTIPKKVIISSIQEQEGNYLSAKNLEFPYTGDEKLSFDITQTPKIDNRCSDTQFFTFDNRRDVIKEKNENYLRYISYDGSLCDHFSYPNISHKNAYLIAITARNVTGLPIRLCITNYESKRCDLYTTLSKSRIFNTDIFLLPPLQDITNTTSERTGYDVNINNFGIKPHGSINDLKSIQIIPIPYNWLSKLNTDWNYSIAQGGRSELHTIIHPYQGLYILENIPHIPKESIIVLNQAYHTGWKAYNVSLNRPKSINLLKIALPFFFGKNLGSHIIVNNWANGWINDNQQTTSLNNVIVFVYLPQYLAYLGFILFAVSLFILVLKQRK
ncbi:MAG: hypothetical protein KatS3mg089_0933 [Patescibacteria group bacterium]|nr:MAG: hypothetical protein KatS3mg089_0933 [Patescibacteria group bacterium]